MTLTRRLGALATAGALFYLVALAALHVLRPDAIERYGNTVSAYSIGPWSALSIAAFMALGVSGLAVAAGLRAALPRSRSARLSSALVAVFGVGFAVAGPVRFAPDQASIAPLIEGRAQPTLAGIVHGIAGLGGLAALMVGMLAAVAALRGVRPPLRSALSAIAGVCPALFLIGLATPSPPVRAWSRGGWIGAIEWRAFLGCVVAWLLTVAAHLRSTDNPHRHDKEPVT
jgi:Protein of unknown function (DUF998)